MSLVTRFSLAQQLSDRSAQNSTIFLLGHSTASHEHKPHWGQKEALNHSKQHHMRKCSLPKAIWVLAWQQRRAFGVRTIATTLHTLHIVPSGTHSSHVEYWQRKGVSWPYQYALLKKGGGSQLLVYHTGGSDSGCSKFLLKSAGPSHHQISRHQKKAFGELYSTVMVGGCKLNVYIKCIQKLRPFPIFPIQISIEWKYKSARCVLNQFTR